MGGIIDDGMKYGWRRAGKYGWTGAGKYGTTRAGK
jgi:hypothetical protein